MLVVVNMWDMHSNSLKYELKNEWIKQTIQCCSFKFRR